MSAIHISELAIYPVKSLAQIRQKTAQLDLFGLHQDRRWMLVDGNGKMITQRQQSRMSLMQPEIMDAGIRIHHRFNALSKHENSAVENKNNSINVLYTSLGHAREVRVWNDSCQGLDCGDEVAHWLSEHLETDCRLVYFPEDEFRQIDLEYAQAGDRTAFSDGFPLLLISQASLDDLNSRLDKPVPMARFRPNIVVAECDAFAEDNWKRIRIGEINMRVVKPCSRCVIPSIDLATGERTSEPTQTLKSYRKRDNKIFFGQNIIAEGVGRLAEGMEVEILE